MRPTLAGLTCALVLASPRLARADILEAYAGLRGGGMTVPSSSKLDATSADFFSKAAGGAVGVEAGIEVLGVDLFANFNQFIDGAGRAGTLTQVLLGLDLELPLPASFSVRGGIAGGLGVATLGPVTPPVQASQVSDRGVVGQATLALDRHFAKILSIGLEGDAGYHYFFGGADKPVTDVSNHSKGTHLMGFLTLKVSLGTGEL